MRKLHHSLLLLAAVICLASCSNDPDEEIPNVYLEIVTFAGQSDQGSTFTLREQGDSPLITYTSTQLMPQPQYTIGSRVVLQYTTNSGEPYVSGSIYIYGAMNVQGSELLEGTAESTDNWRSENVSIFGVTRTGEYLNVYAIASYTTEPKQFVLYADATTLDSEYPEIHLVYYPDDTLSASSKSLYGSFDISEIWNRPSCKGIHFYSNNISVDGFIPVLKTGQSTIQPAE